MSAVVAASVVALNYLSGPFSIAVPPLYFNIRLSAPLLFLVTLIDLKVGVAGAAAGSFVYDLLIGRWFSAVFVSLLGSPVFYVAFHKLCTLGGKVTLLRLVLAEAFIALLKALWISSILHVFTGAPQAILFLGTLAGGIVSNVIVSTLLLIPLLRRLKSYIAYEVLL